jgi:hypothetical protein
MESLFNTQRDLCWGRSLGDLVVIDQGKIIDWMAEKILALRDSNDVLIPDLNTAELIQIGALTDSEGQAHLGI